MDEYKYDIKTPVAYNAELEGYSQDDVTLVPVMTTDDPDKVKSADEESRDSIRRALELLRSQQQ